MSVRFIFHQCHNVPCFRLPLVSTILNLTLMNASGSMFGGMMKTDDFCTGIGAQVIAENSNQFSSNGSITPD